MRGLTTAGPRRRRGAARLASAVSTVAVGGLLLQHSLLLARRLGEGSLLEPAVLGRWLVGLALAAALLGLRRAGVPLFRGRRAAVLWLAVLAFHLAVAAAPAPSQAARLPGAVLPALLLLAAVGLRFDAAEALRPAPRTLRPRPAAAPCDGLLAVLSARPPPTALA